MLARACIDLMLAAFSMARLRRDLETPSRALSFPTLHRRFTIAAWAVVITTGCRPRWLGGTPRVSHTECPTPFQRPLMSEATGFTVSKAAFRRMPIIRLPVIGLCQDLIELPFY